jgi:hypothetical protein
VKTQLLKLQAENNHMVAKSVEAERTFKKVEAL